MGAAFGVDALVCEAKPFYRSAVDQVFLHDLRGIFRLHMAIPDCFRVDDNGRTVFALVEASGLVDPDGAAEAGSLGELLQLRMQFAFAVGGA